MSSGRGVGEVPQPITTQEILAYCTMTGINEIEQREHLFRVIRTLDAVYLTQMAKKRAASPAS